MRKHDLLPKYRKNALKSTIRVMKKLADKMGHRKIKGLIVADGSKQRSYKSHKKSDEPSLTTHADSVIMMGMIDAYERQHVTAIDVQNAFLHSDNDQRIAMAIHGKTAELLDWLHSFLYQS